MKISTILFAACTAVLAWESASAQLIVYDTASYTIEASGTAIRTITPADLPGFDPVGSGKLVVTLSAEGSGGTRTVSSVTYAGVGLSEAIQQNYSTGSQTTAIYYLDNPTSVGNLVVSFSGNTNGIGVSVIALSNVATGVSVSNGSDGLSVNLTTTAANSFVVASNANNGTIAAAQSPLTPLFGGPVGSAGGGAGYQFVATPGLLTPTFTGSTARPVTVAAAFVSLPDTTPPVVLTVSDDRMGGPIVKNSLVNYTLVFNESMDETTFNAVDFVNAGTATISVGTIIKVAPNEFIVPVTPTTSGTLQIAVASEGVINDSAGNSLVTSPPVTDDIVITVDEFDVTPPTLAGSNITDDLNGGPLEENSVITYTIVFSEDMDAATVDASDFNNAGSAPITIGAIVETSPGIFTVEVTPTGTGTLRMQVSAGASLADTSGNAIVTSSSIFDDTFVAVQAAPVLAAEVTHIHVYLLGGQSNADGRPVASGLPTSPVNLQQPQDDVDFYPRDNLTTLRPATVFSGGEIKFGPEITLGRRLSDSLGGRKGIRVAILKYAFGGTNLAVDWKAGGDATTTGDGPRYASFQQTVTNGLTALAAEYPNAILELEGMVWVQGESDASDTHAANYEANLAAFIADVRLTYGADLPFVVTRLSDGQTNLNSGHLATIRAAQVTVADADPLTVWTDTDGFGLAGDNLHFDAAGQQQLGTATAGALLSFLPVTTNPTLDYDGDGDLVIVLEHAFPGYAYTLQTNPGLDSDNWTDVESVAATGPLVFFTYSPSGVELKRFFRLLSVPDN
ncbi:MAG: sialate O-acetylesterase [Verrucomicrobiae bacterium]|nr:sialate O-acetylesterase [Verrucomicrobiae bacterium]NNJ44252.1 hypothetical protein [Akkermansiaceae bacterium]